MWELIDVDQVFWNLLGENEKWYEDGDTAPVTPNSHHFVTLLSSQIGHKLTSEDESCVNIYDFNIPTLFGIEDISP